MADLPRLVLAYGQDAVNAAMDAIDELDVITQNPAAELDDKVLGETTAPSKPKVFDIPEEPSPDIASGDAHSTDRPALCMGEKLDMDVFTGRIYTQTADGRQIVEPDEVRQGYLNNCPLPATLAAMAHVGWAAELLLSMITLTSQTVTSHRVPKKYEYCSGAEDPPPAKPKDFKMKQLVHVQFRRAMKPSFSAAYRPSFYNDLVQGADVRTTRVLYFENTTPKRIHYAHSANGALWPSLIEKAYAIARGHNSYEALDRFVTAAALKAHETHGDPLAIGLDPREVMRDVADTTAEAKQISKLKSAKLSEILKKNTSRPTTAITPPDLPNGSPLTPDHTYAVTGWDGKQQKVTMFDVNSGAFIALTLAEFRASFTDICFTKRAS